jgi:hypothetical protein
MTPALFAVAATVALLAVLALGMWLHGRRERKIGAAEEAGRLRRAFDAAQAREAQAVEVATVRAAAEVAAVEREHAQAVREMKTRDWLNAPARRKP